MHGRFLRLGRVVRVGGVGVCRGCIGVVGLGRNGRGIVGLRNSTRVVRLGVLVRDCRVIRFGVVRLGNGTVVVRHGGLVHGGLHGNVRNRGLANQRLVKVDGPHQATEVSSVEATYNTDEGEPETAADGTEDEEDHADEKEEGGVSDGSGGEEHESAAGVKGLLGSRRRCVKVQPLFPPAHDKHGKNNTRKMSDENDTHEKDLDDDGVENTDLGSIFTNSQAAGEPGDRSGAGDNQSKEVPCRVDDEAGSSDAVAPDEQGQLVEGAITLVLGERFPEGRVVVQRLGH
ncbi:hypothetical protein BJ742DRAFT_845262 [Cladochytrium replicatum]|nr:hypothetical protein BJ742DRAFT_845262 [Cladochytrium replicatum]